MQCGVQDCQYTANCVRYHREENECCGRCAQVGCMHSDGKVPHSLVFINTKDPEKTIKTLFSGLHFHQKDCLEVRIYSSFP